MKIVKKAMSLCLSVLFLCLLFTSCGHRGSDIPSNSSQILDSSTGTSQEPISSSPLLSCEITGRGSPSPYGEAYHPDTDDPYMLHGFSTLSLTESDTGFYFMEVHLNGLYLYYLPKDTMEPVPLCNKPNCLHEKREDDPYATLQEIKAKRMECNAYVDDFNGMFFYKGSLYCVGNFDALSQDQALYRLSPDGSKKEKLYSFHFEENYDEDGKPISMTPIISILGNVTALRGYLYYTVQTPENAILYRISIEGENRQPEALYTYNSNNGLIQLQFYDNYVYIGEVDENGEEFYNRVDVETGEIIRHMNTMGTVHPILSFYEGKIFSTNTDKNNGLYLIDLDGNNLTKIPEPCSNRIGTVAGPYILGYDLSEEEVEKGQYTFTLYNGKGEIQGNFTVTSEDKLYIEGASGNILFLSLVTNGNREHYYLDFSTQTLSLLFSNHD